MWDKKCRSKWKTITVIDENKIEVYRLEVGEKIQKEYCKNLSTFYKLQLIKRKQANNTKNESRKPILKLTANTVVFSRDYTPPLNVDINKNNNDNSNERSTNENFLEFADGFEFDNFTMIDKEQSDSILSPEYEELLNKFFLL